MLDHKVKAVSGEMKHFFFTPGNHIANYREAQDFVPPACIWEYRFAVLSGFSAA